MKVKSSENMSEESTFPSLEEMCLERSLYDKVKIDEQHVEDFTRNILREGEFDAYCIECAKESHFKGRRKNQSHNLARCPSLLPERGTVVADIDPILSFIKDGSFDYEFECTRNNIHKMFFCFRLKDNSLFKFGQYPSIADLQLPNIKRYRNSLPDNDYLELTKAVGLYAHGIGIGSFVYLRRIFERLIENAHTQARQGYRWDEEAYSKSRIIDKIGLLKEYLPEFLVKNKPIYGILSKGIHELGEDECNLVFPIVRTSIELILDEKIAQAEKEKKLKTTSRQISALNQQYGN